MASLLAWISERSVAPEASEWTTLRSATAAHLRAPTEEASGPGWRVLAGRSRAGEPEPIVRQPDGWLLLDRAIGDEDPPQRTGFSWTDKQLADGTPTAAVRWQEPARTLELWRDVCGQRPLCYAAIPGGWIVGSHAAALARHPAVSSDLDEETLACHLAGLPPAPGATPWRAVRTVVAGERLRLVSGSARSQQTRWEPDNGWRGLDDASVVERYAELLRAAVRRACRGGCVALSLSSGLDSSALAALAAQDAGANATAWTYRPSKYPSVDESDDARALCLAIGLPHQMIDVNELVPWVAPGARPACPDSPQQSPYREWKEELARLASENGAELWLGGGFGDDLHSGAVEWVVDAFRERRWRVLARQAWRSLSGADPPAWRDTAWRRPFSRWAGRVRELPQRLEWLAPAHAATIGERLRAELEHYRAFPRPSQCLRLLSTQADLDAHGECWYLQRHGLEQRQPFRDPDLTRFCLSLPADFFQREGQQKWILRAAMSRWLPTPVRERPKHANLEATHRTHRELARAAIGVRRDLAWSRFGRLLSPGYLDPGADHEVREWLLAALGDWFVRSVPKHRVDVDSSL